MSQTNAYRVLEYPDGTGSNPVKKKKIENNIFIYIFYSLLYFPFPLLLHMCLISLSTFLAIYLWLIIIQQCSWIGCFELV